MDNSETRSAEIASEEMKRMVRLENIVLIVSHQLKLYLNNLESKPPIPTQRHFEQLPSDN
jgi:hypothetical protein